MDIDEQERRLMVANHGPEVTSGDVLADMRRWLRDNLADLPRNHRDDVVLVADSLGVHAVETGWGLRELRLKTVAGGACVRLEVELRAPVVPGEPLSPRHGLPLRVVDQLSEGYGLIERGGVQIMWAEVAIVDPPHP